MLNINCFNIFEKSKTYNIIRILGSTSFLENMLLEEENHATALYAR